MSSPDEFSPTQASTPLAFGSFQFDPVKRALWRAGTPVRLSSRVREILAALLERPGEIVPTRELTQRVWRDVVVHESTLRVHLVALRRILKADRTGAGYIENICGHGYRFAAPVTRLALADPTPLTPLQPAPLPLATGVADLSGRESLVSAVAQRLCETRLVTLVGPGGVGKTTLALGAVRQVGPECFDRVCGIDLTAFQDPLQLPRALAAALGNSAPTEDPFAYLVRQLQHGKTLVFLDNCESAIDATAHLAERLCALAPNVHILATSRESLRARDEVVVRVAPLSVPPPSRAPLSVSHAMTFPSVALLVARLSNQDEQFELTEHNVSAVVEICRRLDGLPLALELASLHCAAFGTQTLAASPSSCLELLNRGYRTAPTRHHSLRALLDWTYTALTPTEQAALRRLAVFPAAFSVDAARAILHEKGRLANANVLEILATLEAKSLLEAHTTAEPMQFRMLHTTRCYALEKLMASDDDISHSYFHGRLFPMTPATAPDSKAAA